MNFLFFLKPVGIVAPLFLGLLMLTGEAHARCDYLAGSYLLHERFAGCDINSLSESLPRDSRDEISRICMSGCYLANLNQDKRRQCDPLFASAYDRAQVGQAAQRARCRDRGSWSQAAPSSTPSTAATERNTPENSCEWISRSTVDMTCNGSGRNTNLCGAGGRSVCVGFVSCRQPFRLADDTIPAGTYSASCLTTSGYCERVSMSECFSDRHTTPSDQEVIQPRAPTGSRRSAN
jgi:hypothetical protein